MPPAGSTAQEAKAIVGEGVEVASAFQNVPHELLLSDAEVECDVLVSGTSPDARREAVVHVLVMADDHDEPELVGEPRERGCQAKYNRSAMENARQLQCKALRRREKSRVAKNNGEQWKKQCAEQWKQSGIRADVRS